MSQSIPATSSHALKEWAIVCEAIMRGRQQLLFRTGGIEESERGFEPKHDSFWLFPTKFHQTTELVSSGFAEELQTGETISGSYSEDQIPFQSFCQVAEIYYVDEFEKLESLRPFHVLDEEVLRQRFEYRAHGLFVMLIQANSLPEPHILPQRSHYEGCKSWVDLEVELSTAGLEPVSSEKDLKEKSQQIKELLEVT